MSVSLISAPGAMARPNCRESGGKTRCETNGSTSIKAVPQTRAQQPGQGLGGIGGVRRDTLFGW
ncbi:hypothetical protein MBRU_02830 [Mycolicibacterium brumae DSM 44177]|nr:hypothetical protein MBRU_02830 [Mycolicibacterium brumae DSM 44177]